MFNYIQYEIEDRIAFISLNRPDKRNALNGDVVTELKKAFSSAADDHHVKVIILRGNGNAFSAGADLAYLQELQQNSYEENLEDSKHLMELFEQIYYLNKVVVACVEGPAIAGGCGLATVCDIVYSVPEAKFGYTEVRIGFVPAIVMVFLLRKTGESIAKELLLTGKLINAETAKAYGLVNKIMEPENILNEVRKFAEKLCDIASGTSLALTKKLIADVQSLSVEEALNVAAEINAEARATKDCQRGISAFLNKEKIKW